MRPHGSSRGQAAKGRKRSTSFPNTRGNTHSRMAGRRVCQRSHRTVCTRPQPHGGVYRDVRASGWAGGLGPGPRTAVSDRKQRNSNRTRCTRSRTSRILILATISAPCVHCQSRLRRTISAPSINCRPDFLWNAGATAHTTRPRAHTVRPARVASDAAAPPPRVSTGRHWPPTRRIHDRPLPIPLSSLRAYVRVRSQSDSDFGRLAGARKKPATPTALTLRARRRGRCAPHSPSSASLGAG